MQDSVGANLKRELRFDTRTREMNSRFNGTGVVRVIRALRKRRRVRRALNVTEQEVADATSTHCERRRVAIEAKKTAEGIRGVLVKVVGADGCPAITVFSARCTNSSCFQ